MFIFGSFMYLRLKLFLLLTTVVAIIHYVATFSLLGFTVFISSNSFWINSLLEIAKFLFVQSEFTLNDSPQLYYLVDLKLVTNFIFIVSIISIFFGLIVCYIKIFWFLFRTVSFKKYTIILTGKFIDEFGFVITWLSICALYNQIFYAVEHIVYSKAIMYNSLHGLILLVLFKTKAYGVTIKKRSRALKT